MMANIVSANDDSVFTENMSTEYTHVIFVDAPQAVVVRARQINMRPF